MDGGDDFFVGGVDDIEGFAVLAFDEFVVDEAAVERMLLATALSVWWGRKQCGVGAAG